MPTRCIDLASPFQLQLMLVKSIVKMKIFWGAEGAVVVVEQRNEKG